VSQVGALIGSDTPGSPVKITVRKMNGKLQDVNLVRVSAAEMADTRQMEKHLEILQEMAMSVMQLEMSFWNLLYITARST